MQGTLTLSNISLNAWQPKNAHGYFIGFLSLRWLNRLKNASITYGKHPQESLHFGKATYNFQLKVDYSIYTIFMLVVSSIDTTMRIVVYFTDTTTRKVVSSNTDFTSTKTYEEHRFTYIGVYFCCL